MSSPAAPHQPTADGIGGRFAYRLVVVGATTWLLGLVVGLAAPAAAHDDLPDLTLRQTLIGSDPAAGLLASDNVEHLAHRPGQLGISGCFLKTAPLLITSGLNSLRVFDVSDGSSPALVGSLTNVVFENEAMTCGERRTKDGTVRFALVGIDLVQESPGDIQHNNVGGGEVMLVDVTDPTAPRIRSRGPSRTGTHTVTCIDDRRCRYAYTSGDYGEEDGDPGVFSVIDLTDLDQPQEVDADPTQEGVQPYSSPSAGHKWNFDESEVGTHAGYGSSMWDVSEATHPRLITTTGEAGEGTDPDYPGYNDFNHHNSLRPSARSFAPNAPPAFENGNVLLITEEDYVEPDCSKAGSFQAWWVKRLDGTPAAVVPLDKVELADLGTFPLPIGAFCSAHWFDFRDGIVAVAFYGGGVQFVDARDPQQLSSLGYAQWGASEVWDAMWLPAYNDQGRQTGDKTNIVYTIDLVRGLDVYAVHDESGPAPAGAAGWTSAGFPLGLLGAGLLATLALRLPLRGRPRSSGAAGPAVGVGGTTRRPTLSASHHARPTVGRAGFRSTPDGR